MRGRNGITKETHKHILLDTGRIYANYGLANQRPLGATSGGNTFTITADIRDMSEDIDGSRGKTKGFRRVVREDATMAVNLFEITKENIKLAIAGAVEKATDSKGATGTTHTEITRGEITNENYLENLAYVGRISGSKEPIVILIKNALSDEDFEIGNEDKTEGVLAVTMSAHWDTPESDEEYTTDTPPWAIRYPNLDTAGTSGTASTATVAGATTK